MASPKNRKSNLSIYTKYFEFILYTNNLLNKYPKKENFALVTDIKNAMYKGLAHLIYAIKEYDSQDKLKNMRAFDVQLTVLKIYIRISFKSQYISVQNYQTWCEYVTDLSNMLGGWINHVKKN